MSNQQLPFCFTLLSCSSSPAFRNGQIISTLNKCGLFLCHHGEIEISLENKPYLIRHGDIYIYQPSTLVRLLHKSEDAEGTIIEVDLDYVIPIANKVINAENLLFMRKHPSPAMLMQTLSGCPICAPMQAPRP
jgi:AraC family transcriptional activator of pobA